jgi:hypothetical protein
MRQPKACGWWWGGMLCSCFTPKGWHAIARGETPGTGWAIFIPLKGGGAGNDRRVAFIPPRWGGGGGGCSGSQGGAALALGYRIKPLRGYLHAPQRGSERKARGASFRKRPLDTSVQLSMRQLRTAFAAKQSQSTNRQNRHRCRFGDSGIYGVSCQSCDVFVYSAAYKV